PEARWPAPRMVVPEAPELAAREAGLGARAALRPFVGRAGDAQSNAVRRSDRRLRWLMFLLDYTRAHSRSGASTPSRSRPGRGGVGVAAASQRGAAMPGAPAVMPGRTAGRCSWQSKYAPASRSR